MKDAQRQIIDSLEWSDLKDRSAAGLVRFAEMIRDRYGARAIIDFDAGANNVSVRIVPSKNDCKRRWRYAVDEIFDVDSLYCTLMNHRMDLVNNQALSFPGESKNYVSQQRIMTIDCLESLVPKLQVILEKHCKNPRSF